MSIWTKKLLKIVVISLGIGALSGIAGQFLGLNTVVLGGLTGAICGVLAVYLIRQQSQ